MLSNVLRGGLLACLVTGMLAGTEVAAQLGQGGAPAGVSPIVTRLFGDIKGFTAQADVQVLDAAQKALADTPMGFAYLDRKLRIDLNLEKLQAANKPAALTEMLKKMNMAQITSIVRPDKLCVYVLWPGPKVMITSPLAPEDPSASTENFKITKSPLGKETVDGHSCVKNKVTLVAANGSVTEATTWNAADLKDFPVRIETLDQGNTSRLLFRQISLTRPEAGLFEPPAGYTRYSSPQELMQAMESKFGGGQKK